MKTLLITEIFPPKVGGSGRWFWEIYSRLPSNRYSVFAGNHEDAEIYDKKQGISCFRWPLALATWSVLSLKGIFQYGVLLIHIIKLIKKHRITEIHCGRAFPEGLFGLVAFKFLRIPYLCYVHGEELQIYQSSKEFRFLSALVFASAGRIIVNSNNTQLALLKHVGNYSAKIRLMHPGVDIRFFCPAENDRDFRDKMGWLNRKVILTVGRLQKRKGQDHVILSLNKLCEQIPDILYVIVGDGEDRLFLEELVATKKLQDNVQFMGKVDDKTMLACYQQCDLFVLANRDVDGDFEGFGMVLVEAQACGKPVIAGESGGTAETMIPGGTGILINAEDPEIIAHAIVQLLLDREKSTEMGKRGVAWVNQSFDWVSLVVKAESIFAELQNG